MSMGQEHNQRVFRAHQAASTRSSLAESPLWDNAAGLRWIDISGQQLHLLTPSGEERSVPLTQMTTAIALTQQRLMLAVTATGFGTLDPDTGRCTSTLTAIYEGGVRMNDAAIDPAGRCWAGSLVEDGSARGALYRLDSDGLAVTIQGLGMSNGIDWSPSADWMYHVDSTSGIVRSWGYDVRNGRLDRSDVVVSIPPADGLPDGLTVDSSGRIWLAIWGAGEVRCIDPRSGVTLSTVKVPTPCVTSCAFGGEDYSTLYITTADEGADEGDRGGGLLYRAEVDAVGRPSSRFMWMSVVEESGRHDHSAAQQSEEP